MSAKGNQHKRSDRKSTTLKDIAGKLIREGMSDKFYQEYMCVPFKPDPLFEAYVGAWEAYHKAADAIDGDLRYPDPDNNRIRGLAIKAGNNAMDACLTKAGLRKPSWYEEENYKLWQSSKMEALRRMENRDHTTED